MKGLRRRVTLGFAALIMAAALAGVVTLNDRINRAEKEMKDNHLAAATRLLTPLAQAGDARAQNLLAYVYLQGGDGVPKNPARMRYWAGRLKRNLWSGPRDRDQADWYLSREAS